jgi:hypothetical protein
MGHIWGQAKKDEVLGLLRQHKHNFGGQPDALEAWLEGLKALKARLQQAKDKRDQAHKKAQASAGGNMPCGPHDFES